MDKLIKTIKFFFFFSLLVSFSSCFSMEKNQQPDNTKPMYGEVLKNEIYKKLDKEFIENCIQQYGTIDSAVIVHINYAWGYFYRNDVTTAMKRFNQAWLLNPEFPDSYFGFAALLDMQKNTTEAVRFYKIGLKKDSIHQRAEICYQKIADCKEQLNDIVGTIEVYTKITVLNPNNAFAFKKLGYLQIPSEAALNAFDKAISLDPNDPHTFINRGYLYQLREDYPESIIDFTKAISLAPENISDYVNRGIVEMLINNNQDAKKDFEMCVHLNPKSGELHRFLGLSKLNLNDKQGACTDFEKAKELGDEQSQELINQNCK
ncbi:MAG: hypothetical protein LBN27_00305 [Prevotellaceae bacterium]|jgi:tetratricopeptide (TPR) repeat protein|nr:hypothetical protein [Prevotellaceae bacterium]